MTVQPPEQPIPRDLPISPDCSVRKHPACSGDAWDAAADELTACACPCHQETREVHVIQLEAAPLPFPPDPERKDRP